MPVVDIALALQVEVFREFSHITTRVVLLEVRLTWGWSMDFES